MGVRRLRAAKGRATKHRPRADFHLGNGKKTAGEATKTGNLGATAVPWPPNSTAEPSGAGCCAGGKVSDKPKHVAARPSPSIGLALVISTRQRAVPSRDHAQRQGLRRRLIRARAHTPTMAGGLSQGLDSVAKYSRHPILCVVQKTRSVQLI